MNKAFLLPATLLCFSLAAAAQVTFRPIERLATESPDRRLHAFNTPNFANPVTTIGSPTAGQITNTVNDNRDLQASIKLTF